jgi:hypothetical protein
LIFFWAEDVPSSTDRLFPGGDPDFENTTGAFEMVAEEDAAGLVSPRRFA